MPNNINLKKKDKINFLNKIQILTAYVGCTKLYPFVGGYFVAIYKNRS
jgi:hypothetical protein